MTRMEEWLYQNRRRSYPMDREPWRKVVSPESGLDCVLLDALVFDADAKGDEELVLKHIAVSPEGTLVGMRYGSTDFQLTMRGGSVSGEGSVEKVRLLVHGAGERAAFVSLALSSHEYIRSVLGVSSGSERRDFDCRVMPTRVIRLQDGFGVDFFTVNGSYGVEGGVAAPSGDIVLEDGYRTSPVVYNGKVVVRVGSRYGLNPCKYDFGYRVGLGDKCKEPLFYFCGQNGVNSGNVVLKGGKGIMVRQGGTYKGKPCIEIVAGRELMDLYNPDAS